MDVIERGVEALGKAVHPSDGVRQLVGLFYSDEEGFAGSTFLGVDNQRPNAVTCADLLAVTLMGEVYPAKAVRSLLEGDLRVQVEKLLADIPTDLDLWGVSSEELHEAEGPHVRLWYALKDNLHDVGPTKVSKLMARKRPRLFPIYDKWIGMRVATVDDYWRVYHAFLIDPDNRSAVDALRPDGFTADSLPALRLIDTAVWMRYSEGRSATAARAECGL